MSGMVKHKRSPITQLNGMIGDLLNVFVDYRASESC